MWAVMEVREFLAERDKAPEEQPPDWRGQDPEREVEALDALEALER